MSHLEQDVKSLMRNIVAEVSIHRCNTPETIGFRQAELAACCALGGSFALAVEYSQAANQAEPLKWGHLAFLCRRLNKL